MNVRSLARRVVGVAPAGKRRAVVGAVATCAGLALSVAHADVYKCAGDGGRPIYQEMPCPPGKELRNFQSDPPEITVLPGLSKGDMTVPPPPPAARAGKETKVDKASPSKAAKPRGDPAERKHLRTGMSEGEVLARIGPPDATTGGKNGKQQRWSWFPADGDPETLTTVTLMAGIVTNVERTLVKR